MSTVKTNNVQIGQSVTATNNFTWYQPSSPDGTVRLGNGNAGATSADLLTVNSSGNVGIGTSSPSYKLDVSTNQTRVTNGTRSLFTYIDSGGSGIWDTVNEAGQGVYLNTASSFLALYTGSTERMRLDSSGNLGLGVTPSGWSSDTKGLQIGAYGVSLSSTAGYQMGLANNAYYNSGWKYTVTSYQSALYAQNSGTHAWYNAPSGTAGNAISFTQAMTLDASGRLGVGTTSPAYRTSILTSPPSGNVDGYYFTDGAGHEGGLFQTGSSYNSYGVGANQTWLYSGGYDLVLGPYGNANVRIVTYGSERARIDSSGNLLVGTTSLTDKLSSETSSSTQSAIRANATNSSFAGTLIYGTTTRGGTSGFDFIGLFANSVGQFRVNGAGTIYAQNTTVQSISDARLKENIKDATDGLDVINALRPVRFDWKEGYGNDRKNQIGFIAQEVEPVFPDAVDEWSKVSQDDAETYKTVGPSALIPVLVKAIQELSAELNELKKRIN